MNDPNKKNNEFDDAINDSMDNLSDASEYHEPYAKTPSPPIPTRTDNITPADSLDSVSTTSSVSSRLGHLEAQKRMHADARQAQAARNSITSITDSSKPSEANSKTDKLISNSPHDENEMSEDEEDVEKVLEAEMVSDEEISARDLETVVNAAYFDLFVLVPLLLIPGILVFFMAGGDYYNIFAMKDPNKMNSAMEFVRYNLFATGAYALFIIFDVLSLVIPEGILVFTPASKQNSKTQKFIRSQLQMVINIRHNFALSAWLFTMIIWASTILYQSMFTSPVQIMMQIWAKEAAKSDAKAVAATSASTAIDEETTKKIIAEGKHLITQRYIEVTLVVTTVFSAVLAVEKYLMQMIKLGFHREAFAERISDCNRRFVYLLKLYEAVKYGKPRVLSVSKTSLLDIDSTADLNLDKALHLTSVHRAKSIAKLIFRTLLPSESSRDREYLVVEDFEKWTATPKETFESLDLDNSGKITEEEMEEAIVNIYIARDNLCRGLKSNGRIVKKLDYLFLAICFFIGALIVSPVFDVGAAHLIGYFGICSTGFGFLFNSTAKSCFESILFVFIQHPFDVGDRVVIDDESFVIDDIEIFTTKMIRWDGVTVYIANSTLCSKVIQNIRRSENQLESLALKIKSDNPAESLWTFRQELEKELKARSHSFTGEVDLANLDKLPANAEALSLTVLAQVHGNFQNTAKRNARKTEFLEVVETALKNSNLTKA